MLYDFFMLLIETIYKQLSITFGHTTASYDSYLDLTGIPGYINMKVTCGAKLFAILKQLIASVVCVIFVSVISANQNIFVALALD